MRKYLQFYSIVIVGVTLFDVVGSFASRIFLFDHQALLGLMVHILHSWLRWL
jgi:hypothetical protein